MDKKKIETRIEDLENVSRYVNQQAKTVLADAMAYAISQGVEEMEFDWEENDAPKKSGDLFGENIEDFDNVVKYDMKKFFSVEDFAAIESHFYGFEKPILDEKRKEKWYVLIEEEDGNTDDRSTDVFENEDTAITVMNDNYLACVKNTKLISGVEKQITDNMAYVKVGKKNYYRARIIEKTMPFAVIYGDMFSNDFLGTYFVQEFLTYSAALRYVNELRIEDYMIV